ncbi:hypothetical protein OH492_26365 [Vibrio chagasii]|nr:hypothetical protein [Vibrio chagasii]
MIFPFPAIFRVFPGVCASFSKTKLKQHFFFNLLYYVVHSRHNSTDQQRQTCIEGTQESVVIKPLPFIFYKACIAFKKWRFSEKLRAMAVTANTDNFSRFFVDCDKFNFFRSNNASLA